MADFNKAVKVVLKNEGKFNDDPHDAGHATAYGISLRFLVLSGIDLNADNTVDIKDILALTPFEAKKIYKKEWWDKYKYGNIQSQPIATKIFDLAVNMGSKQAHLLAQRAINQVGINVYKFETIKEDGILGSKSIAAINFIDNRQKELTLLYAIRDNAVKFYIEIASNNSNLKRFLAGWISRGKS